MHMDPSPVAIISGGSRGLGAELAGALLAGGWRVATFSRASSPCVEEWRFKYQNDFFWQAADSADFARLRAIVAQTWDRWQGIDALINNAAVSRDALLPL